MTTIWLGAALLLVTMVTTPSNGFMVVPSHPVQPNHYHKYYNQQTIILRSLSSSSSRLYGGGFGGGGGGKSDNKKKSKKSGSGGSAGGGGGDKAGTSKLKPKQQWDRYSDLKRETKIRVGVRRVKETAVEAEPQQEEGEQKEEEWLEVGRVKTKDNKYTELAVVRQRAIIAEHAKRLYPLQISSKKPIEWGYYSDEDETWIVADKSIMTDDVLSKIMDEQGVGIEKVIGFEGRPDPASGFYCVYDGGRLKKD